MVLLQLKRNAIKRDGLVAIFQIVDSFQVTNRIDPLRRGPCFQISSPIRSSIQQASSDFPAQAARC